MPPCNSAEAHTCYQLRPLLASVTVNSSHCHTHNNKQEEEEARVKYKGYTLLKQYKPIKSITQLMKTCRADIFSGY